MGDNMTAKQYLRQIKCLTVMIKQKQEQAAELEELNKSGNMGVRYGKDRVQSSRVRDGMDGVVKYIDIIREVDGDIEDYVRLKNKIVNEIQGLTDPSHVELLYKRYVEFKRFEVIAVEMNYSYDRTRHVHGDALIEFEKRYHPHGR